MVQKRTIGGAEETGATDREDERAGRAGKRRRVQETLEERREDERM